MIPEYSFYAKLSQLVLNMTQPAKKPKLVRLLLYYLSSLKFVVIIKNWYLISLGYLKILDFSSGKYSLELFNGLKFYVGHFMDAWAIKEVFGENDYRLGVVKKKQTIIDIGANIGTFTVLSAISNTKATVICFEPSKPTFKLLQKNIQVNNLADRVFHNQMAVGGEKGILKLFNSGPSGLRSLFRVRSEQNYEMVSVTTLKDIFHKYKINRCDYLKIDCEGAEYAILESCPEQILKSIKHISLEFHEMLPSQKHHHLIDILENVGFKITHSYNKIENNIGYIYAYR